MPDAPYGAFVVGGKTGFEEEMTVGIRRDFVT